ALALLEAIGAKRTKNLFRLPVPAVSMLTPRHLPLLAKRVEARRGTRHLPHAHGSLLVKEHDLRPQLGRCRMVAPAAPITTCAPAKDGDLPVEPRPPGAFANPSSRSGFGGSPGAALRRLPELPGRRLASVPRQ